MVSFTNCKINIGLHILRKRDDGYHDLQTIFYPVALKDALEIITSGDSTTEVTFSTTGIPVAGKAENNLCIKAYHLLKKDFPQIPAVKMHLHKAIPMGAGLGGGSADAAFTLQLLNTKYQLSLSTDQLISYSLQLGSDCPFFIINKPCYATGRGEVLEEIDLNLSACKIIIINPGIHINTGLAFSNIMAGGQKGNLKEAIQQPVHQWKDCISNDFEKPVFSQYPEVGSIKDQLYANGALYASMSGSGSSVYGIFEKDRLPEINFPGHYFCQWV
jgi:4-diphosphocytidyl-2-C-methyl-D-erythritol kinase